MATYTKFAILGPGNMGNYVTDELLKNKNFEVRILTRDPSKPELAPFKERGAKLCKIDYDDLEGLKEVMTGVEVVVSTISVFAMHRQELPIRAAKAAGVELFIPAEYGVQCTDGPNTPKKVIQDLLKEVELPSCIFHSGYFYEAVGFNVMYNFKQNDVKVVGKGDVKFSVSKRSDVAQVIANIITTAPKEELKWAVIPIEAYSYTHLELAAIAEKFYGTKIDVKHLDYEEEVKNYYTDYFAFLGVLFADGRGVCGSPEEIAEAKAKYYPDFKFTKFEEFLAGDFPVDIPAFPLPN